MQDLKELQESLIIERHPSTIQAWPSERQNESPYYSKYEKAYYDLIPPKATRRELVDFLDLLRVVWIKRKHRTSTLLSSLFTFRDPQAVVSFLRKNDFLVPLLIEANKEIKKHFPESQTYLELVSDPEAVDEWQLFLYISTKLAPREARPILKRLDNEWWLAALERAQGKLCISLEYQ